MPAPALKFSRFFRIWLCGEHRVVQAMPFCAASQTNIKCPDDDSVCDLASCWMDENCLDNCSRSGVLQNLENCVFFASF